MFFFYIYSVITEAYVGCTKQDRINMLLIEKYCFLKILLIIIYMVFIYEIKLRMILHFLANKLYIATQCKLYKSIIISDDQLVSQSLIILLIRIKSFDTKKITKKVGPTLIHILINIESDTSIAISQTFRYIYKLIHITVK